MIELSELLFIPDFEEVAVILTSLTDNAQKSSLFTHTSFPVWVEDAVKSEVLDLNKARLELFVWDQFTSSLIFFFSADILI